jgi:hypothetical protein
VNLFFVCGAPKSGTTWLQRLLDAHPQVCCSGEGHFVTRFSIPAAKVINDYNDGLSLETKHVYEGRPYYAKVEQAEFDDLVRDFILRRLAARADAGTGWVGDKTPGYTVSLGALHRLFPAAKIIHIVRDPRDVAVSSMGYNRRAGIAGAFEPGSENNRRIVERCVQQWLEALSAVDDFAADHPALVHEVVYERLHDRPVEEAERLFGFLGASTDRALLDKIAAATSFEALAGRPRGVEDPSSFLRKGVVGDWKAQLDADAIRYIAENCGDWMRRKRLAA